MTDSREPSRLNVIYIPHGGGPLPLLGDSAHRQLVKFLRTIPDNFARPSAVIVISAHWEQQIPTLTAGQSPAIIYDYGGFPPESYRISYPASGQPELAESISRALESLGIESRLDHQRGFDHGLFVPLKLMYPQADIPCVQLSLLSNLDAGAHIKIGQALSKLDHADLLILGSGFSFHNLKALFNQNNALDKKNEAFEDWLVQTLTSPALSLQERTHRLVNWIDTLHARYCHPREEHLLPLHVCFGVKQSAAKLVFDDYVMGKRTTGYQW